MKSGFRVFWSNHALDELNSTFDFLESNWTEKEIVKLSLKLEHTIELISKNPEMFQISLQNKGIRRAVVMKNNSMYYRVMGETIEILSFFSNRQHPNKEKL